MAGRTAHLADRTPVELAVVGRSGVAPHSAGRALTRPCHQTGVKALTSLALRERPAMGLAHYRNARNPWRAGQGKGLHCGRALRSESSLGKRGRATAAAGSRCGCPWDDRVDDVRERLTMRLEERIRGVRIEEGYADAPV
jgi:hypothetical protein